MLFSYFMLTNLIFKEPGVYEYLVWVWAFTMWIDELRQFVDTHAEVMLVKLGEYFSSKWNIYDQVMFILFFTAVCLRSTDSPVNFEWSINLYAISLIAFILRVLPIFCLHKFLGPKVVMIYRMLNNLFFFCAIFLLFLFAYGITAQSLLYPNSEPSWNILLNIVNKPYFAIFQQIDVILHDFDESVCSNKSTVDFKSELGIPKCSWLIVVVFVLYIIVIWIMLINLLIATFSNTFNTVEKDARKTWLYYRFEIITEYLEKPALVPPLTTISYLHSLIFCTKDVTTTPTEYQKISMKKLTTISK